MMTGDNLNDEQLQQIVDKTIIDAVAPTALLPACRLAFMRALANRYSPVAMATAPARQPHTINFPAADVRPNMHAPAVAQRSLSGHLQSTIAKPHGLQDQDGDGKISFEEFAMLIANTDLENKMTIPF
jgi:hypothetical protein